MKAIALVMLVLLPTCARAADERTSPSSGSWVSFEPAKVDLEGALLQEEYWGPPNYGENPDSDTKESVLILKLGGPINVKGDPQSELNRDEVRNVERVQLQLGAELRSKVVELVGRRIRVRGALFTKHLGHHHTPVLLDVESVSAASDSP